MTMKDAAAAAVANATAVAERKVSSSTSLSSASSASMTTKDAIMDKSVDSSASRRVQGPIEVVSNHSSQQLTLATQSYCLCRSDNGADTLSCDTCQERYHLPCVGLRKLQADKIEHFECLRCAMRSSLNAACCKIGCIVNNWLSPEECARRQESSFERKAKYD